MGGRCSFMGVLLGYEGGSMKKKSTKVCGRQVVEVLGEDADQNFATPLSVVNDHSLSST